jgi:hypothetical protein
VAWSQSALSGDLPSGDLPSEDLTSGDLPSGDLPGDMTELAIAYCSEAHRHVALKVLLFDGKVKGKAVPLHAMEALWGRGDIAPTHSRPRH